jgi:rsbT co-antagonist protein RsbR
VNDRQPALAAAPPPAEANLPHEEDQMNHEADREAPDKEPHQPTEDLSADDERADDRPPRDEAGDDGAEDRQAQSSAERHDEERDDGPEDRPAESSAERDDEERDDGPDDRQAQSSEEPDDGSEDRQAQSSEEPDDGSEDRQAQSSEESDPLLQELVAYLRENRTELREEWARRISEAELLGVMSDDEIFSEATEVYDNYVDALETGSIENLQTYARELSERIIPRGVETHEVLGIVLLLRDVLARSLFAKYQKDLDLLNRILDSYEPAANRIAVTVGVSFVEERERVIHEQQEAMRELSTPVLQLREHLLILPIIGALDSARARQLTEQLLGAIQQNRAKVVVIDITGVATIDRTVANHLVQTVEASRLMGASTILTGLSSEIAQTLVDLGVDLGMMKTVGDLQGGLEEAERLAGYRGGGAGHSVSAGTS